MLVFALSILPSTNLVRSKFSEAQLKLSSNHAGEIFWMQSPNPTYSEYYFQNIKLTRLSNDKFIGGISLYADENVLITGFSKMEKSIFSFPVQNISLSVNKIKTRKLDNPSSIRIPSSFFNELEKIETSQIETEKNLIKTSISKDSPGDSACMEAQYPIDSVRTSNFGSYRRLPTGIQYFHTGLDLRAPVGTKIYAMADGEVSLAQKFVIAGNAVIIDHGEAIFSKYYHMSEIAVKPGQKVKKGDTLGESGNTGRVEAPHLHWEVSWKGIPTDPAIFMDTIKTVCL